MIGNEAKILIADDNKSICELLETILINEGFAVESVYNGLDVMKKIKGGYIPDILLLDVKMPGMNGIDVLKKVKSREPDIQVVMITAFADINGAVTTIKSGAHDYISKPFKVHEVIRVVHRALAEQRLKRQVSVLSTRLQTGSNLREMMGPSDRILPLISDIQQVAPTKLSVLISGEAGSGKGVVAKAIHLNSHLSGNPFVMVDCTFPTGMDPEEELFGVEMERDSGILVRKGRIEMASGGTLYLKQVSMLSSRIQKKLGKVLSTGVMKRKNGREGIPVDIRIIASADKGIEKAVASGGFSLDVYYMLGEFRVAVPPLRERKDDILYLARLFMETANIELGKHVRRFSREAISILLSHDWPGNIRELRSAIRSAVFAADSDVIEAEHLVLDIPNVKESSEYGVENSNLLEKQVGRSLKEIVTHYAKRIERDVLVDALSRTGGDESKAAGLLRIDPETLRSKVLDYGIEPRRSVEDD